MRVGQPDGTARAYIWLLTQDRATRQVLVSTVGATFKLDDGDEEPSGAELALFSDNARMPNEVLALMWETIEQTFTWGGEPEDWQAKAEALEAEMTRALEIEAQLRQKLLEAENALRSTMGLEPFEGDSRSTIPRIRETKGTYDA